MIHLLLLVSPPLKRKKDMDEFVNDDSDEDLPVKKKKKRKGGSISGSEPEEGEDGKSRKKKRCVALKWFSLTSGQRGTRDTDKVRTCVSDPTKEGETTATTRRDRRSPRNSGSLKSARSWQRYFLVSFLC